MENLDRVVRSQDLPDADRLLASSPAFKYANPNSSSYLTIALFENSLHICFYIYIYIYIYIWGGSEIRIQSTSHRKHITSPLQSPTG
jgi:hypothetical protein